MFGKFQHPVLAKGYRETIRAIRTIGRECVQKRISAIENGEQVPNDILTHIVKITSGLLLVLIYPQHERIFIFVFVPFFSVAKVGDIDIEDLVDDFSTFYVAGKLADLNNFIIVVQKLGLAFLIPNRGTARLTKF